MCSSTTIDENYTVELLKRLVQTRSVNPFGDEELAEEENEEQVAQLVFNELSELGIPCRIEYARSHRPVVMAEIGRGMGKTLMLNTHMDTVGVEGMCAPFSAELKDGRLYGRGSTDAKSSLAAMLTALRAIVVKGIQIDGRCIFTAVCDEEHEGLGTKYVVSKGTKFDSTIVGEPTNLEVAIAQTGGMKFKIVCTGKATHGCTPEAGVNAITKMAMLINALGETTKKRRHPLIGYPTFNIGRILGGVNASIVPDYCQIDCDRRLLPKEDYKEVIKDIELLIERLKREDREFEARVEPPYLGPVSGFEISAEERIVHSISQAYRTVMAREPRLIGTPYAADGMYLYQKGISAVTFGPGDVVNAHASNESIEIAQLVKASQIYALTILDYCS